MKSLFVGPTLLSGIGQVTRHYATLFGHESEFVSIGDQIPTKKYDLGFAFVLPIAQQLDMIDKMLSKCKRKVYMTVCETETVHPQYEILVNRYKTLYVPSEFCLTIFMRQFPQGDWKLLRHWAPTPPKAPVFQGPYTFYTIGNVLDPRKNVKMLIEAFIRLNLPNSKLLLKATCKVPVNWKIPNMEIINDLLSSEDIETRIHQRGHCYVNCSYSEGVGMGAVEAALRDKPVILSEYGGLKEYVPNSPFVISCTPKLIEADDFLYQKGMTWSQPSFDDLMKHMKTCYDQRIYEWDHSETRDMLNLISL